MPKDPLPPYLRPGIDDVQQMDESGEVDLAQIRYNLSLTTEQRFEQYGRETRMGWRVKHVRF